MSEEKYQETYLWSHAPLLSSPPQEMIDHVLWIEGNEIYEKGVFLLENGRYLYVSYNGMIDNPNTGITDIEELWNHEDALELFNDTQT